VWHSRPRLCYFVVPMKMKFEAEVADKKVLQLFLQHIRDFDTAHFEDVKIKMWVDAPELKLAEVEEIMRSISPPWPLMKTVKLT